MTIKMAAMTQNCTDINDNFFCNFLHGKRSIFRDFAWDVIPIQLSNQSCDFNKGAHDGWHDAWMHTQV